MGMDSPKKVVSIEQALTVATFGRYQLELTALCGALMVNCGLGMSLMSFVLPAAECDFEMSTEDKGWLSAISMLGTSFGCFFWGIVADKKGRKFVLIVSLLVDGIAGVISSAAQYYVLFTICRFINGFALVASIGSSFTYLGEFVPINCRERALCWLEVFGILGIALGAGMAWIIIPIEGIRIQTDWFVFDSWNLFILVCSIPSLMMAAWLWRFAETPKFLVEYGDEEKALEVLRLIFHTNTGENKSKYPVQGIIECKILSKRVKLSEKSDSSLRFIDDIKIVLKETTYQIKLLLHPDIRRNVFIVYILLIGITTSFYTLLNWLPELFNRYEYFETINPEKPASLCEISKIFSQQNATEETWHCGERIPQKVFKHALITAATGIPFTIVVPLCVKKVGAKILLFSSIAVCGVLTISLLIVQNSIQNLVISCLYESFNAVAFGLTYCVAVDLFPTNLRMTATATGSAIGRFGGLVGNLLFGYMLDLNCIVPIAIYSGLFWVCSIVTLFLPSNGKTDSEKENELHKNVVEHTAKCKDVTTPTVYDTKL